MDIRDEWINRPANLMCLSLAEYIAAKDDKAPIAPPVSKTSIAKSGGRPLHEPGKMNGLEKKYAQHLEMRKMTGEILDWKFEAIKLKLAPATFYNPDFLLLMPDGRIELWEVKGFWEDDARVKIKVAAEMFSGMFSFRAAMWNKKNKDWKVENF